MTRVLHREVVVRVHPGQEPDQHLHLIEHMESGWARVLTGVADGQPAWREVAPGDDPDHRDGIRLAPEWPIELRRYFAPPAADPGTDPSHTAEELAALRAELEEWRKTMAGFIDVDRERVDRLIDGIRCQP